MYGAAAVDAYDRITSRAQDLRDAFLPGGSPQNGDVTAAPRILETSDPLSVAVPPGAWLVTRDAAGQRSYLRDGALSVGDGTLRASDGAEVLGYPGGDARGAVPVPLRLPERDRALGRCTNVRVGADGGVAYTRTAIDPRTGARSNETVSIGRLALARFPAGTQPARLDATHVAAPPGVVPHVGTPGDGTFAALATSSREAGSVDIDAGVERLNEAYRQFEAMAAAVRSRAGVDKTTLDLVK